ncbi:MAG: hypothetical protein ACI4XF_03085 [Oscillospiraceae bacterium]
MRASDKTLPDFGDPDIWNGLKKQCYDGRLIYSDYPADEYKYFDRLQMIYREYRAGDIPKAEAEAQEQLLAKEYRHAKQTASRSLEVYQEYQKNIKRLDSLRIEINKADTLEGKIRAALEIISIVTGDKDFGRRNMP